MMGQLLLSPNLGGSPEYVKGGGIVLLKKSIRGLASKSGETNIVLMASTFAHFCHWSTLLLGFR